MPQHPTQHHTPGKRPKSGALSKGEDDLLFDAALTDSVRDGDVGQGPLAYTPSDLVYGQIQHGRQALLAVVALMVGEKAPDRGVIRHRVSDLRTGLLAHLRIRCITVLSAAVEASQDTTACSAVQVALTPPPSCGTPHR